MENEQEQPIPLRESAAGIWRHLRPHKGALVLLVLFGLFSAIANGVVPYVTGHFFDALIALSHGETGASPILSLAPWMFFLVVWAGVQAIANSVDWVEDRTRRRLDTDVQLGVQAEGFVHLLQLPLAYHANERINGALGKLGSASWRMTAIVRTVVTVTPQILSVIIGITLAASINLRLAGILALGVLVYGLLLIRMLRPAAEADTAAHKAWNDGYDEAAAAVHQTASVKQSRAEAYEIARIRQRLLVNAATLWDKMEMLWSNVGFYQRAIVFATQLTIFLLAAHMVADGSLSIGGLIALNGYALMFFGPFVQLGYSWQTIQNGLTAAGQVERMFREPTERYHPMSDFAAPLPAGVVAFDGVHFRYEAGQNDVLRGVSFEASAGTVVALVGESGAGKSTIAQLICGYYFPTGGRASVDGVDTREWDLTELRSRIAVVPQEVALFNDSIEANIKYGAFDASREQVAKAAKDAHIDEFIASLPKGYDTLVGERGVKLSVGQKQRVAIARAILRDPKILILDEPTSALDAETERYITASLDELMQGRTTFIIAHRLSTVRKADLILVLKDGAIAEHGTHDELVAIPNGVYRHLYELHVGLHE